MKQNSGNKKSAGEIFSKILTVICAFAAVVFIGVTALAFVNESKEKAPDTGSNAPGIITTEPSTTLASADTVKVKRTVYAKAQAKVMAEPAEDATVVAELKIGDSVGLAAIGEDGWCTVTYDNKVCYVHRSKLTTKQPITDAAATTETAKDERKVVDVNQKRWSIVVVDKDRKLPDGYEPELVNIAGTDYSLEKRVAEYFEEMYDAALADGITLTVCSAYRSYSSQESRYNELVTQYVNQGNSQKDAEAMAAKEILPAGSSEHNLGYAVDLVSVDDGFKDTEEYKWLCENAYKYGFIERYPEGAEEITGVMAEPWHWRFIGPYYANDMHKKGINTLEEFFQSYGVEY